MATTLAHFGLLAFSPAALPKSTPAPLMDQSSSADSDDGAFLDLDRTPFYPG